MKYDVVWFARRRAYIVVLGLEFFSEAEARDYAQMMNSIIRLAGITWSRGDRREDHTGETKMQCVIMREDINGGRTIYGTFASEAEAVRAADQLAIKLAAEYGARFSSRTAAEFGCAAVLQDGDGHTTIEVLPMEELAGLSTFHEPAPVVPVLTPRQH